MGCMPVGESSVRPLVVSGASGVGKGTIVGWLLEKYPDLFELSISMTTRAPRSTELDGREYFFVSKEGFHKHIEEGSFVEYCQVHGNYYGTHRDLLRKAQERGKIVLLDIDVQGAIKVNKAIKANFLWLDLPSEAAQEQRLRARATDSEEVIQVRLKNAKKEVELSRSCSFYHRIVNDDLERCRKDILEYLQACYPLKKSLI